MTEPPRIDFDEDESLEIVRIIDAALLGGDDGDLDPSWIEEVPESERLSPTDDEALWGRIKNLSVAERAKLAVRGNKEARTLLLRDSNRLIQRAVLKNPRITEDEILVLARNRQSDDDLIRGIVGNRDWMKVYAIRHAIVENPKTPLHQALRLLGTVSDRDLAKIGKSKNVASAVATQARRMTFQKKR